MTVVREPSREITVVGAFDVVVIGGGIAGVAASLAARRRGANVALVEKACGLGGLATLGNVIIFLPLCDGRGRQVIGGIGEELLHLSVKDVVRPNANLRMRRPDDCWLAGGDPGKRRETRFDAVFNPASFQLELEALLVREGIEIFYDTRFCACATSGERLTHVIVENKSGRLAIAAKAFVDASGDADLCTAAGENTEALDTNVLSGWHYTYIDGQLSQRTHSNHYDPKCGTDGAEGPFFSGHRGRDVTQHLLQTRTSIRERFESLRKENPDSEIYPFQLASIPSFRATRRLRTSFSLNEKHRHQWVDDTVALTGDWRKSGPVYPLPLRCLQGEVHPNLFAAGRCISVDTTVWDATRAIPTCAATGEASGVAAAMVSTSGSIDVSALQQDLRSKGMLIDPALVEECP